MFFISKKDLDVLLKPYIDKIERLEERVRAIDKRHSKLDRDQLLIDEDFTFSDGHRDAPLNAAVLCKYVDSHNDCMYEKFFEHYTTEKEHVYGMGWTPIIPYAWKVIKPAVVYKPATLLKSKKK